MATFKVTSISTSFDGDQSLVIVTAPGHDFTASSFVTINNCATLELNGTFRIISVDKDLFSFMLPFNVTEPTTFFSVSASSLAELTISPKVFSDTETNMTYLYGVSDFWAHIFEGREKIDLLLEAETQQSSEVYNRFLQLTSTLSLGEIQTTFNTQLKLVILRVGDLVPGTTNTYYLPEVIPDASFIMNRPLLPTLTLEKDTHFSINDTGTEITLFEKLDSLNFPLRKGSDGVNEFALWFSDAKIDEQLISRYYGRLIAVNPQQSTEKFKNFVYGLFYLYSRGPNLALFKKGLNLALGLPLARDYETVLDIRQYLETNQYMVITDLNQYLIPYGVVPTVSEGDYLYPSQELAEWIEIKDWTNDGKWWLNLYLPEAVLPYIPEGKTNRYAIEGSYADQVMEGFLKNHTFLVNVNVTSFKDIQNFQELYDIIYRVKPSYTTPLYIWSVPIEEILPLEDVFESVLLNAEWCENLSQPISRMVRNNPTSDMYLYRGCPQFIRFNVSSYVAEITGGSSLINGYSRELNGGIVDGYVNYKKQYEAEMDQPEEDKAWIRTLFNRHDIIQRWKKSMVKFNVNQTYSDDSGVGVRAFPVNIQNHYRMIPLYISSSVDLNKKAAALGLPVITQNKWSVEFFKPTVSGSLINQVAINEGRLVDYSVALKANFSTLFTKAGGVGALTKPSNCIPPHADVYQYTEAIANDIQPFDYVLAIRIYDYAWGVYWITSNPSINAFPYAEVHDFDSLSISVSSSKISRGMGPMGNPYYLLRGAGMITTQTETGGINSGSINSSGSTNTSTLPYYEDAENTIQVMDRSGKLINIRKDLL